MKKVLACMIVAGLLVTGCTQTTTDTTGDTSQPAENETSQPAEQPADTQTPEETTPTRELPKKPVRNFTKIPESLQIGESHVTILEDGSATFKIYSKAPDDREAFVKAMKENADKDENFEFLGSEDKEEGVVLTFKYKSIDAMQAKGIVGAYSDFDDLFKSEYGPEYTALEEKQIIYDLAKENFAKAEDLKALEGSKIIEFPPMQNVFITLPGKIVMANTAFATIGENSLFSETGTPISIIYVPTAE